MGAYEVRIIERLLRRANRCSETRIITAMDKKDSSWFVTEDGVEGRLSVSKDYNRGFGSMVSKMPE